MYSFPSPIELLFSLFHFILLPIAFFVCLFRLRKRKKPELYFALLTILYYASFIRRQTPGGMHLHYRSSILLDSQPLT
jgi:hypothetical protein